MGRIFLRCTVLLLVLSQSWAANLRQLKPLFPALRRRMEEKSKEAAKAAEEKKKDAGKDTAEPTADAQPAATVEPAAVTVPAPPDAGSDGFPKLPEVSQMLGEASSTLKSVNSEASSLEKRVVQAQTMSTSKMAKQKAAFEEKLKAQEDGNRAVVVQSSQISDNIEQLKKDNADLRLHAKELQEGNRLMRSELRTLESRLGAARDFVVHSLSSTDDTKAPELAVLQVPHSTNRDDDDGDSDDSDSDDESDGEADSFLTLSATIHHAELESAAENSDSLEAALPEMEAMMSAPSQQQKASPGDLLEQLSKEVATLATQEKASIKKLKDIFIRDFRAGARRHQALVTQQRALNSTRNSLLSTRTKLQTADAHLEDTRSKLQQRLQGLGHFMQKLAHFALAPTKEVKHLQQTLPKAPVIPQPKKDQPQVETTM